MQRKHVSGSGKDADGGEEKATSAEEELPIKIYSHLAATAPEGRKEEDGGKLCAEGWRRWKKEKKEWKNSFNSRPI